MKPLATLALASFVIAGSACSEAPATPAVQATEAQPGPAASEVSGTLNLSLPSSAGSEAGGTVNLNVGGSADRGGLIIGAEGFGGGNFGEAPTLEIDFEDDDATLAVDPAIPADDIVRLPEPK